MSAGDWVTLLLILAGEYLATGVGMGLIVRKLMRDTLIDVKIDELLRAEARLAIEGMGGMPRLAVKAGLLWPVVAWVLIKVRRDTKHEGGES